MQKFLDFFKNPWTKRGASALSALYGLLILWLAWASYAYIMEFDNVKALYAVYLIISFLFGALMIYARKQPFTAVLVMLLIPANLVIVLLNFGSWFYILPSTVLLIVLFFAVRTHETLKVVLGTIYLLLYVLSVLAFIAFTTVFGGLNLHGFEVKNRAEEIASPEGTYRYVRYVEPQKTTNRRIYIYTEPNTEDVNLGLVRFKQIYKAKRVYSGRYDEPLTIDWKDDQTLTVNGFEELINFDAAATDTEGLEDTAETSRATTSPAATSSTGESETTAGE